MEAIPFSVPGSTKQRQVNKRIPPEVSSGEIFGE